MYIDKYTAANGTNACEAHFDAQYADRWAISHIVLPFLLVHLHRIPPSHSMLLVYVFETLEMGVGVCMLNVDVAQFEQLVDTAVLDPLYGALGICAAIACISPHPRGSLSIRWAWVTLSPTVILWAVDNDIIAQLLFGVASALVLFVAHGSGIRVVKTILFVLLLSAVGALVPYNPLYTTGGITILFSVAMYCSTSPLPDYRSVRNTDPSTKIQTNSSIHEPTNKRGFSIR
jgi:hypothetical protein